MGITDTDLQEIKTSFRTLLLQLQQRKGSRRQLAREMNVSHEAVAKWESLQTEPTLSSLVKVAKVAEVSLAEFGELLEEKGGNLDLLNYQENFEGNNGFVLRSALAALALKTLPEQLSFLSLVVETIRGHSMTESSGAEKRTLVDWVTNEVQLKGREEFLRQSRLTEAELNDLLAGFPPSPDVLVFLGRVLPLSREEIFSLAESSYPQPKKDSCNGRSQELNGVNGH